jgi:hypothetical protein
MAVRKRQSSGRTMRDSNTVNIAGVAKKPLILTVYRNQLIIRSLRSLPKEKRKIKNILN